MSVVAERVNASGALAAIPLRVTAPIPSGGELPALCTPTVALIAVGFVAGYVAGQAAGTPKPR